MGAISRIISRFTSGGRTTGRTGRTTPGATTGGAGHSQDAKIGRAVRTAAQKLTGKR